MRYYGSNHHVERKPDGTFVTTADIEIEESLQQMIHRRYAEHVIFSEETNNEPDRISPGNKTSWIIDPIDGTHNYLRNIPVWATLIAYQHNSSIDIGVVSAPALGTRWWAIRGEGAYRARIENGQVGTPERIHVSDIKIIADAQIILGELIEVMDLWPNAETLLRDCWRARGFADFWGFTLVAEGAAEVMIEAAELKPWDTAALIPILEEAGGRITDINGGISTEPGPRIATNGHLHDAVLQRLAQLN